MDWSAKGWVIAMHTSLPPARRRVGVIGAGRVGAVLAAALQRAGHEVVAAHGLSDASRQRAQALLPGVPLVSSAAVVSRSDLVLLTVPDDPLMGLVQGLARSVGFRVDQVVAHTSGRHGVSVLAPAAEQGAHALALHPAMTFTGTAVDLDRLSGTRFGVTCAAGDEALARAIVDDLGGVPVTIDESDRPLYHAALAHGANHLVTLVADAMDLLAEAGVDDPAATLRPLLSAALDNALDHGSSALTGPVARGDAGTVAAHLRRIAEVAPDSIELYAALARHTAARAVADGRLRASDAAGLLDALAVADAPRARTA
jgi:predicted short-subunit dehydrogenase-like oxidoreductase (DUF2520 family)